MEEKQISSFETFQGWKCKAWFVMHYCSATTWTINKASAEDVCYRSETDRRAKMQDVNFSCGRGEEDYLIVQRLQMWTRTKLWSLQTRCCGAESVLHATLLCQNSEKQTALTHEALRKNWPVPLFSVGASNDFNVWIKPTSSLVRINPYKFGLKVKQ